MCHEKQNLFGKVLLDFINTPNLIKAADIIFDGIKVILNFSEQFSENAKFNFCGNYTSSVFDWIDPYGISYC